MTASAALPRHKASSTSQASTASPAQPPAPATNFLRHVIEHDLARGAYAARLGVPHRATRGDIQSVDRAVVADPARVRTRFPPEPNGYLHIGHAKSICLNFGLARDYDGVCHLRFDDTNPEREDVEYVDAIIEMVRWLGFDWDAKSFERDAETATPRAPDGDATVEDHLYFASEYFELLYEFAEYLIRTGHAYVDSQSADEMRAMRGSLVEAGRDSPDRTRTVDENLALFHMMRAGDFPDGAHVLRARIDMASPNINLRDPVLYRIRHARHHRTGDAWCIYPMYDYTHCVSDALENITHSICTLEFEDHRPLYDWVLERIVPILRAPQFMHAVDRVRGLRERGIEAQKEFAIHCHNFRHKLFASAEEASMRSMFDRWEHNRDAILRDLDAFFELLLGSPEQFAPLLTHALEEAEGFGMPNPFGLPHQYEFSRMNLTYVVTSKRKLKQLVDEGHVDGWDDPRMPTLVGLRRRGYTPASIRMLCDRVGVSKSNTWTDYAELDQALRDDLDPQAARAFAILDPVRLVVTNYPDDRIEPCSAPLNPHDPGQGQRSFPFARELMIEREDFQETPQKGFFRLAPPSADKPGSIVRLKYGYVVRCTGFTKDADGRLTDVTCEYLPDTFSGTPGADSIKVKGNIAWISAAHARPVEVRLYDRLFVDAQPDAGGRDFLQALNAASKRVTTGHVEPGVEAVPGSIVQFERLGYFVADRVDSTAARPVYNRIATLR
ncbi:MAG: glutamine--tRNA ligase, partial [Burkholderiaceae bacterium]